MAIVRWVRSLAASSHLRALSQSAYCTSQRAGYKVLVTKYSKREVRDELLVFSDRHHKFDASSFLMQQGCLLWQTRGLKAAPKQMEVILTADINKVGKAGEIVKVAKGYARNMLIPQLLALPKLDKYVTLVRKQLRAVKAKHPEEETVEEVKEAKTEEQRLKELNTVLTRLDTQRVVVRRHTPRRSTELHTHVTPGDIVAEVKRQQKIQIEEINLEMSSFLTMLGDHEIPIRLPKDVQIPGGKAKLFLKVKVRRA